MTERDTYLRNPTLEYIATSPRRECLLALNKWGPTLSVKQLAAYLAATEKGESSLDTTEFEAMQMQLIHMHLPVLENADFISWDGDNSDVQIAGHPALDDPRFERLLRAKADNMDTILSALSHEYRRITLSVLEIDQTKSRTELAHEIHHRLPVPDQGEPPSTKEIELSLHHMHLPSLDDIDVINFDPDTGDVTYNDNPVIEQVFTIIFDRDDSAVEKLDGFLDGLADSYPEVSQGTNSQVEWPHFWNDPYYG
ncbi:hypothetical protein ACFO5R_18470 [Halosolutus amylolyticus]|uniref:DUF7344 domain-containing protein n=1 Tax=Halosolutus amylolyticus TaxID=2932267 RepID=A0ABD5PTM4_9EURY|nr:hypothetical protein [Halosolutus amylolyticus]